MSRAPSRAPRRLVLPQKAAVDDREAEDDAAGSVFFIGTATTLLRYRGITLLTRQHRMAGVRHSPQAAGVAGHMPHPMTSAAEGHPTDELSR